MKDMLRVCDMGGGKIYDVLKLYASLLLSVWVL